MHVLGGTGTIHIMVQYDDSFMYIRTCTAHPSSTQKMNVPYVLPVSTIAQLPTRGNEYAIIHDDVCCLVSIYYDSDYCSLSPWKKKRVCCCCWESRLVVCVDDCIMYIME
jgi:hypothetical protein